MIPAVIEIAGGETCQFPRTSGASKATTRAITVAIAVALQATVRRKAGSVPWVARAKGRIALRGPRVRKNRTKMSPVLNSNCMAEPPIHSISTQMPELTLTVALRRSVSKQYLAAKDPEDSGGVDQHHRKDHEAAAPEKELERLRRCGRVLERDSVRYHVWPEARRQCQKRKSDREHRHRERHTIAPVAYAENETNDRQCCGQ